MKLPAPYSKRSLSRRNGFAVLITFALLVLISILCVATMHRVTLSRDEIALIEKKQQARLAATTNSPPTSTFTGPK